MQPNVVACQQAYHTKLQYVDGDLYFTARWESTAPASALWRLYSCMTFGRKALKYEAGLKLTMQNSWFYTEDHSHKSGLEKQSDAS